MKLLSTALVALVSGCIVQAPTQEGTAVARSTVSNAPPIQVGNGANLEDKVEIQGALISPGKAMPGETVRVKVQFRVLDAIPGDYTIFVHLEDVEGRYERLNADHAPVGGSRPTSSWKKDEIIIDEFPVYVPPGAPIRGLNVLIGFWDPKTDKRLVLKNVNAVRHDNNNRILLATIPVQGT